MSHVGSEIEDLKVIFEDQYLNHASLSLFLCLCVQEGV